VNISFSPPFFLNNLCLILLTYHVYFYYILMSMLTWHGIVTMQANWTREHMRLPVVNWNYKCWSVLRKRRARTKITGYEPLVYRQHMWNEEHSGKWDKFRCFGNNNLYGMVFWLLKWKNFLKDENAVQLKLGVFCRKVGRPQLQHLPQWLA
jgi:hypothetical protein